MEKQGTKYILGIALVAIWGLLAYRIYQKMNPDNSFFIPPANSFVLEDKTSIDSFKLLVNYRDPFLEDRLQLPQKEKIKPRRQINVPVPPQQNIEVKKKAPVQFPEINYKGSIYLKSGRKAALLTIDRQIMNLGLGESYNEIYLMKIHEDSIRLRFSGEERTFMKGFALPEKAKRQ